MSEILQNLQELPSKIGSERTGVLGKRPSSNDLAVEERLSMMRVESPPSQSSSFAVVSYAGHTKKGYTPHNPKKKNQDSLLMAEDESTKSLLLGCFDGHGEFGHKVSQYFKAEVEKRLFRHPSYKSCVKTAIKEIIAEIEKEVLRDRTVDTNFSGTTMVLAVVQGQNLVIANVGDSRAILGFRHEECSEEKSTSPEVSGRNSPSPGPGPGPERGAPECGRLASRPLTIDHKPELPGERERILGKGGRVFAITYENGESGPERVWHSSLMIPGLAMSRSFCDTVAHSVGVSSEPEFTEMTLDPHRDCVLILATDGLWEFMTNQEAVEIAACADEPSVAVNELMKESSMRWLFREGSVDDTTVCVAFLEGLL